MTSLTQPMISRFQQAFTLTQSVDEDRIVSIFERILRRNKDDRTRVVIANSIGHMINQVSCRPHNAPFMLSFHTNNPSQDNAREVQRLWQTSAATPARNRINDRMRENARFLLSYDLGMVATSNHFNVNPIVGPSRVYHLDFCELLEALEAGAWQIACGHNSRTPTIAIMPVPEIIHTDSENRLHSDNGPALLWKGLTDYYWHGTRVPAHVIEHPGAITLDDIHFNRNMEIRRVMLERYGLDRFITNSRAKVIDTETFRGRTYTLYQHKHPSLTETIVVARVTNATPEPNGSFKDYWLRTPPWMTRVIDAVAWTFNMQPGDYRRLDFES